MIKFIPVDEKHLKQFQLWRNELYRYFRQHKQLTIKDQYAWYDDLDDKNIMYSVIDKNKLIGCAGLTHIDWVNRTAELSFYIGKVYVDCRSYDILFELLKRCFDEYNFNRAWVEVYDFDPKVELLEKTGFTQEAELRGTYFYNGKYHSSIIFSMLRNEYENTKELDRYVRGYKEL